MKITDCDFLKAKLPRDELRRQWQDCPINRQNLLTGSAEKTLVNTYVATVEQFTAWLRAYQAAWQGKDLAAAAKLFSDDARYYWTPLVPPQKGPAEIAAAWEAAITQQRDIRFTFDVFGVSGATGMATWRADFVRVPDQFRVRFEGVLSAEFASAGQCRVFRDGGIALNRPAKRAGSQARSPSPRRQAAALKEEE